MNCELVTLRSAFERIIGELKFGQTRFATVPLMINQHPAATELIVNQPFQLVNQVIDGSQLSPFNDWLIIEAPGDEGTDPRAMIAASRLRRGQLLCLLQIGLGRQDAWRGALIQNGNMSPLARIRLIGPEMPVIERDSRTVTRPASTEWLRMSESLGDQALAHIHNASVMLFGAGKIGSLFAQMLVMQGIRRLVIADFDKIEIHNLFGTFGATHRDIGKSKANVLAAFLGRLRPDCAIHAIDQSVNHSSVVEMTRGCDLIVDAVDHDTPRLAATMLSNTLLKVNISIGSIVRFSDQQDAQQVESADHRLTREIGADVKLLLPGTCCVCATGISNLDAAELELKTAPVERLHLRNRIINPARAGSLASINVSACGAALQMWFDLLTGHLQHSLFQRIRHLQGVGLRAAATPIVGNAGCKYCGRLQSALQSTIVPITGSTATLIRRHDV